MYGLVLYADGKTWAAVSASKRKLKLWSYEHKDFHSHSSRNMAWRMRDKTGWCDGSPDAYRKLFGSDYWQNAVVIW